MADALRSVRDILRSTLHPDLLARIEASIDAIVAEEVRAKLAAQSAIISVEIDREDTRKFSEARNAVIKQQWVLGIDVNAITDTLNRMPGRTLTSKQICIQAHHLGVKRPAGFSRRAADAKPRSAGSPPKVYTPERLAVLREHWPKGTPVDAIYAMLAGLPGAPVSKDNIKFAANHYGLRRPSGFMQQINLRAAQPPAAPAAPAAVSHKPLQKPAAPVRAVPLPAPVVAPQQVIRKPSPPLAAFVPPRPFGRSAPPPPTSAQRQRERDAAMVAEHIAKKGVTRCPTAILEPTTAIVPAAERAAVAAYDAARDQERKDEHMRRTQSGRKAAAAKITSSASA